MQPHFNDGFIYSLTLRPYQATWNLRKLFLNTITLMSQNNPKTAGQN